MLWPQRLRFSTLVVGGDFDPLTTDGAILAGWSASVGLDFRIRIDPQRKHIGGYG